MAVCADLAVGAVVVSDASNALSEGKRANPRRSGTIVIGLACVGFGADFVFAELGSRTMAVIETSDADVSEKIALRLGSGAIRFGLAWAGVWIDANAFAVGLAADLTSLTIGVATALRVAPAPFGAPHNKAAQQPQRPPKQEIFSHSIILQRRRMPSTKKAAERSR